MLANPYTLAAAAIAALGYGIYKLITYQTEAEKAQEKLNNAISESEKVIGAERLQIDAMFARLKAAKEGTDEYRSAKEAIMSKYGEYLKGLGMKRTLWMIWLRLIVSLRKKPKNQLVQELWIERLMRLLMTTWIRR